MASRVHEFRQALLALAAPKVKEPVEQEPPNLADPDVLAEAFTRALSRFTTADGSLKVTDQGGQSVVG